MVSREELERFLDRLSTEGVTYTELEPGLWRLRPGGALSLVVNQRYAAVLARAMAGHFVQAKALLDSQEAGATGRRVGADSARWRSISACCSGEIGMIRATLYARK